MPASADTPDQHRVNPTRSRAKGPLLACALLTFCVLALAGPGWRPIVPDGSAAAQEPASPTSLPGTGTLIGQAWVDSNGDDLIGQGEPPLAGVAIQAKNVDTGAMATDTSGADGTYRIAGLPPGVYEITATAPSGYELTTLSTWRVFVVADETLRLNFGARVAPTATPTPTSTPALSVDGAERVSCGGVYSGDTKNGTNNVSTYSCRPWWDESGKEEVYRLELGARQPVTVTLLNASADLDLFMLRSALPESCLAAGDNYLSYPAEAGAYFLAIDGYRGASGSYAFRVDCPLEPQATQTPTYTPSATPTSTPTGTRGPTLTPTPSQPPRQSYLPLLLRAEGASNPRRVTFIMQEGLNGYSGAADTTLDSSEPTTSHGGDNRLSIVYAAGAQISSPKESLLRFDLSLLPSNATIEKAVLRLYAPSVPLNAIRAQVAGLLRPWDEQAATWEAAAVGQPWNGPGATTVGSDRTEWVSETQEIVAGSRWYEFDVTLLVRAWFALPVYNYGMIVSALAGSSNMSDHVDFVSRDDSSLELRPQLLISCILPGS